MGYYYIVFLFLLCALPHVQCAEFSEDLKSPIRIAAPKKENLKGNDTNQRAAVDLRINEIRSDGVIIEWDKVLTWENEIIFVITLTPDSTSTSTPWPNPCYEEFICNAEETCSRDTKNILGCSNVPGCSEAIITVRGGSAVSSTTVGTINIVTGPSSGKNLVQGQTPDYSPVVYLVQDGELSARIQWQGPDSKPDGLCAEEAFIYYWFDGIYQSPGLIKRVAFGENNIIPIQLESSTNRLSARVTYGVKSKTDNFFRDTEITGYKSLILGDDSGDGSGNGAESSLSSTSVLIWCSLSYFILN